VINSQRKIFYCGGRIFLGTHYLDVFGRQKRIVSLLCVNGFIEPFEMLVPINARKWPITNDFNFDVKRSKNDFNFDVILPAKRNVSENV